MMFRVDLLPFDLTTQLIKVLSIDTKREKGKAHCTAHCGVRLTAPLTVE